MKKIAIFLLVILSCRSYTQNFWQKLNAPLNNPLALAITTSGYIYEGDCCSGIYRTTDNCITWDKINNGLPNLSIYGLKIKSDEFIFAGTERGGVFRSNDKGDTWVQIINGLTSLAIRCIAIDKRGYLYAGTEGGIFCSTNDGDNWTRRDSGLTLSPVYSIAFNSQGHIFAAAYGGGIFRSTNDGANWTSLNNGLTTNKFWTIIVNSADYIFAGSGGSGLFRSTDNGDTWTSLIGPSNYIHSSIASSSGQIFIIYSSSGVYRSTSIYGDFSPINSGIENILEIQTLGISPDGHLYVSSIEGQLYRSINSMVTPVELNSFNADVKRSNINLTWRTATELNNKGFEIERRTATGEFTKIAFVNGNGTTTESKTYAYVDKDVHDGRYSYRLRQIDFDGESSLSKTIEVNVNIIEKFNLEQNYPNPFNPSTVIKYQIPQLGLITIKIYNMLGKEIATLVHEVKNAGIYELNFDGSDYSSGVYFYSIKVAASDGKNNFSAVKKMILLK